MSRGAAGTPDTRRAWAAFGAVFLVGLTGSAVFLLRSPSAPSQPPVAAPLRTDDGARGQILPPAIADEGKKGGVLSWSSKTGRPQIVDINRDGTEDIVGRTVIGAPGQPGEVYVSAVDGVTWQPFWSAGPYKDLGREIDVRLCAGPDHVAVMDAEGTATLLDARNGQVLLRRPSGQVADTACAAPPPSGMLWLGPNDGQGVLIDGPNRRMMTTPRPEWCPRRSRAVDSPISARAPLPTERAAMAASIVAADGEDQVAFGLDSGTRKALTIAGFGAKSAEPRWVRALGPEAAQEVPPAALEQVPFELDGGTAYLEYPSRDGAGGFAFRLQAFSAKTGKALWDVPVLGAGPGAMAPAITLSATRLYLPHDRWLDVMDRASGARLGRIGP